MLTEDDIKDFFTRAKKGLLKKGIQEFREKQKKLSIPLKVEPEEEMVVIHDLTEYLKTP